MVAGVIVGRLGGQLASPASFGLSVVDDAKMSRVSDALRWISFGGDPGSQHNVVDHSPVSAAE